MINYFSSSKLKTLVVTVPLHRSSTSPAHGGCAGSSCSTRRRRARPWCWARSTSRWVDGGAIRAVAARVVQRRLQRRVIPGGGVRHAPALHVEVELVHLGHVRVKQAEVLLDIVWSASLHVPVDCSIA
jgi:hypothetical protein